ncbi:MAG: DUF3575 domain-containing protein [Candidatus Cryptobacteroides sp.]
MNRTYIRRVILTLVAGAILVCQQAYGQKFVRLVQGEYIDFSGTVEDSLLVRIPFPHAVSNLQNYPKVNIAAIELMQMLEDPDIELDRVYVCGSTSPEGLWGENVTLSQARTDNVARYIQYALDIPEHKIIKKSIVEDWDRLADMIEESEDLPYKYEALNIIRTKDWGERKTALRKLGGGKVWKILEKDYFPELRSVRFGIFCKMKPQPEKPKVDTVYVRDTIYIYKELIREAPKVIVKEQPEIRQTRPRTEKSPAKEKKVKEAKNSERASEKADVQAEEDGDSWKIGIKTNLLTDALVIPDLALELQLFKHISFNIEGWYTPYNIFAPAKDTNFSGFRPQFRYWFGRNSLMRHGNYVAIDGSLMWYTLKWRDGLLYQNGKEGLYDKRSSNMTPAWSAGVSYGYCFGLGRKKAWGIELELGIGYQRYTQNVGRFNDYSQKWEIYDYQEKQQFGITHANISLTYRFSIKKNS